jgi:hypothetical protein
LIQTKKKQKKNKAKTFDPTGDKIRITKRPPNTQQTQQTPQTRKTQQKQKSQNRQKNRTRRKHRKRKLISSANARDNPSEENAERKKEVSNTVAKKANQGNLTSQYKVFFSIKPGGKNVRHRR